MKYIITVLILFISILFNMQKTIAQKTEEPTELNFLKDVLGEAEIYPNSPSAATFTRYGEYSVNNAYGNVNISIPLFNIKTGDFNIPLALNYNSGGNKVNDRGEWPGLGWSLNIGGIITRSVIGKPDEQQYGFLSQNPESFNIEEYINGEFNWSDYDYLSFVSNGVFDTQPDIFSYNFDGYSGKFILYTDSSDKKLKVLMLPYQPIKISPNLIKNGISGDTEILGFRVKTDAGMEYYFGGYATETTKINGYHEDDDMIYNSTWHITRKALPVATGSIPSTHFPLSEIQFSYEDKPTRTDPQKTIYTAKYIVPDGLYLYYSAGMQEEIYFDNSETNEKRVKSIIFATGKVNFDYLLNTISLIDKSDTIISKATLHFGSFDKSSDCSSDLCYRKRLDKVIVDDKTWEMYYEEIAEPPFNTSDRDHWGYYNGAGNGAHAIPNCIIGTQELGGGANRETNPEFVKFGMLKKIIYPTKGYTEFTFGANRLSDNIFNGKIKKDITQIYTRTLYSNENSTFSVLNFDWPVSFAFTDGKNETEVFWEPKLQVDVEFGTKLDRNNQPETYIKTPYFKLYGDRIELNELDFLYSEPTVDENELFPDQEVIVYKDSGTAYLGNSDYLDSELTCEGELLTSGDALNYVKCYIKRNGYYWVDADSDNSFIYVGGVRIENITNYDSDGKVLSQKEYSYNFPDALYLSSAKLTRGTVSSIKDKRMYITEYSVEPKSCIISDCKSPKSTAYIFDSTPSGFESINIPVVYTYVTEISKDSAGNTIGKTEYNYTSPNCPAEILNYPRISYQYNSWDKGYLKNIKYYDNSNKLKKSIKYNYGQTPVGNRVDAFAAGKNRTFDFNGADCCDYDLPDFSRFVYRNFYIESSWKPKLEEINIDFFDDDTLQTKTHSVWKAYGDFFMIQENKTGYPAKDTIKIVNQYDFDLYGFNGAVPNNIRETSVHKMKENGTYQTIEARVINYDEINYKPSKIFNWKRKTPDDDFINLYYNGYSEVRDNDYEQEPSAEIIYEGQKPIIYKEKDGIPRTFIWSNDYEHLLAYVENCDNTEQIFHTSFELRHIAGLPDKTENEDDITIPKTGLKYYTFGEESFTFSLPPGDYTIEFWAKDESNIMVNGQSPNVSAPDINGWKRYSIQLNFAISSDVNISGSGKMDELRAYPSDANMKTYTYKDLIGLCSETDENGRTIYYEYDEYNRLKLIRDNEGNIIKKNEYHYKK